MKLINLKIFFKLVKLQKSNLSKNNLLIKFLIKSLVIKINGTNFLKLETDRNQTKKQIKRRSLLKLLKISLKLGVDIHLNYLKKEKESDLMENE